MNFLALTRGPKTVIAQRGVCSKRKYASKAKANKAKRKFGGRTDCKSAYECRHCGSWHLTSQEQT